jgi:nucleotide-binding universal stress UspA family protein
MNDKTILCAIDFSKSSLQALKWTIKMAQLTKAKVTVLFCYRLITAGDDEETLHLKKNIEDEALKKFNKIEKEMINGQSVSYQFVVEVGFFSFRIEMFIRKSPVGLLVMGDSIIPNFNEYKNLNFEQFLKNSKVPVVIVSEEALDLVSLQ